LAAKELAAQEFHLARNQFDASALRSGPEEDENDV
jgi:hypothetical protein